MRRLILHLKDSERIFGLGFHFRSDIIDTIGNLILVLNQDSNPFNFEGGVISKDQISILTRRLLRLLVLVAVNARSEDVKPKVEMILQQLSELTKSLFIAT